MRTGLDRIRRFVSIEQTPTGQWATVVYSIQRSGIQCESIRTVEYPDKKSADSAALCLARQQGYGYLPPEN